MKVFVACLFLFTSVTLLATIAPAQKGTTNKSRSATIKIWQGVPIPEGYIVVAFMTSSSCPHGAYLIKKQDGNDSPITGNRGGRQPSTTSTGVSRPRRVGTAQTNPVSTSQQTGVPSSSATETTAEPQPPKLSGANEVVRLVPQAPTLSPARAIGSPVNGSTNAVAAPKPPEGPEEVSEGDVVRIDTAFVTVPVSVLDRQGRFVPNLRREDFIVFENGIEQSIAHFEAAEKPFTVALLLDTSASTRFHLWEIKEAAINFAKQLRPQDRVLVVSFNDQVLLLTEVTNDLNVVSSVIEQNATPGSSTRLYDAVDLVVKERLNKIKGRKAIVLFTDGVDTSSFMATYQSTLREAEELDALIYPIQYDSSDYLRAMQGAGSVTVVTTRSNWPFPGTTTTSQTSQSVPLNGGAPMPGTTKSDYDRADQYLHLLADKSGGRLYKANDPAQLAQAFTWISEELRRQYSLGYYPQGSGVQSGERRQIKVRVHQPNLAVRARESYVRSTAPAPAK